MPLRGGTSDQATQGLYGFGAGYGTTVVGMLNQNGSSGYPSEDQASMLFLFSTTRPSASDPEQGDLIFRVSDAAHYTTVSTNGAEYVMVENAQPNVPYLCLVEVRPDAGENGKDLLRARAVALDEDFERYLPADANQFFAGCEVISGFDLVGPKDGTHLQHVVCGGKTYTSYRSVTTGFTVYYDEFGIATKFKALCPLGNPSTLVLLR